MSSIHIDGNGNYSITEQYEFKPAVWCDNQWTKFCSAGGNSSDLIKRIMLFIPLVFASLVIYPITFVCGRSFGFLVPITTTTSRETIIGSGNLTTRILELNSHRINQIVVRGTGNLVVKTGNANTLTTSTDDNILNYLEAHIDGNKLTLTKSGSFQFIHPPSYVLNIPTALESLSLSGSCTATVEDVTADKFDCNISGSGKVEVLKGTVNSQDIQISGSGQYRAPNLIGGIVQASISGSAECFVRATKFLKVEISGSGECKYVGSPQITKNISGSGSIKQY